MNKQTSVFFLSLTLLASGNTFGQEAPTKEETSCFNNLAALTTENFEQTENAYAQCLEKEAVRFDTQSSLGLGKIEQRYTAFSKNNSKLETTVTKEFIPFVTESSEKCSDKTINCAALTSAMSNLFEKLSIDYSLLKKVATKDQTLPLLPSSMSNAEMFNFNLQFKDLFYSKLFFFKTKDETKVSVVSKSGVTENDLLDNYECLYKDNNQMIYDDYECKRVFDLVQEAYDKQYPDKKA
jgi:hypothetical protein